MLRFLYVASSDEICFSSYGYANSIGVNKV